MIIQIEADQSDLYALDDKGNIYMYCTLDVNPKWKKLKVPEKKWHILKRLKSFMLRIIQR